MKIFSFLSKFDKFDFFQRFPTRVNEAKKVFSWFFNSYIIFFYDKIEIQRFFFRWNLNQIPTNLKMSQNNKKKSGKTFSQLTNIKYEFFFSLTFESNFLQMVTSDLLINIIKKFIIILHIWLLVLFSIFI